MWDQHYPSGAMNKRSRTPDLAVDGVYNFTMVAERCEAPVASFRWDFEKRGDEWVITDRTDVPAWLTDARVDPKIGYLHGHVDWAASSVAKWCEACVKRQELDVDDGLYSTDRTEGTGLSVSVRRSQPTTLHWPSLSLWFAAAFAFLSFPFLAVNTVTTCRPSPMAAVRTLSLPGTMSWLCHSDHEQAADRDAVG
eukprot:SAG22_NODE_550_length_9202_cov_30.666484_3_plen_195_part_00